MTNYAGTLSLYRKTVALLRLGDKINGNVIDYRRTADVLPFTNYVKLMYIHLHIQFIADSAFVTELD